jgi:hypothetical protein
VQPVNGKIDRVTMSDFANSKIGEIAIHGVDFGAAPNKLHLGGFVLRGFDFKPTLASVAGMLSALAQDPAAAAQDPARLAIGIPHLDEIAFTDLDANVVPPATPNPDGQSDATPAAQAPQHVVLGSMSLKLGNWLAGAPTKFGYALDHFKFDLPADDPKLQDFTSAGITQLDVSTHANGAWDADKQEFNLPGADLGAVGLGKVTLSATASGITSDAFSTDSGKRQAALMNATVTSANVAIENEGGLQKIIAAEARQQGKTPEDIKKGLLAGLTAGVPPSIADSEAFKELVAAIQKFCDDPKSLHVTITSKDGIGAADMATPEGLMDKIQLKATANE